MELGLDANRQLVVGVDWSYDFCRRSRDKALRHGLLADYVCCDAGLLPFTEGSFDIVLMLDSLRCLKGHSMSRFLREALRTLKPGGRMYVTGLDSVAYGGRKLPAFKDARLPFNWNIYIPRRRGTPPFITREPRDEEAFDCLGALPCNLITQILSRFGVKAEITWNIKEENGYKYLYYIVSFAKA